MNAKKLYRALSSAEISANYKNIDMPVYALRLLVYLYDKSERGYTVLSDELKKEFGFVDSKLFRVTQEYLRDYILVDKTRDMAISKPLNRYTLTRRGVTYVDTVLKSFND